MKLNKNVLKLAGLVGVALMMLNACGATSTEAPEKVIQKAKETAVDIKAADLSLAVVMNGKEANDNINFNMALDAKIDRRADEDRKADVRVKMNGALLSGEKKMDGDLDLEVRILGENLFFNLAKLESNNADVQKYKELISAYRGKWLKLASDFVPESVKNIQKKDEKTLEKEKQSKELFVGTKIFEVNKEYGVESLNGKKVYHYGVQLNENGVREYVRKNATINGREMTDAEVDEAAAFVKSVSSLEMWIGVKDYYLYKGVATLTGESVDKAVKSDFNLTYTANSYNAEQKIDEPAPSEEFNPVTILMGLQLEEAPTGEGAVIPSEGEPVIDEAKPSEEVTPKKTEEPVK